MSDDSIKKIMDDTLAQFVGKEASRESVQEMGKILIPVIRNIMPSVLAQDIVGVQPMQGVGSILKAPPKYREPAEYAENVPKGYLVIDVNVEISKWIEEQPLYHWKHGEMKTLPPGFYDRYIISEKLYTWMKLRWES